MSRQSKIFVISIVIILATLACDLGGNVSSEDPSQDAALLIETSVAATLAAGGEEPLIDPDPATPAPPPPLRIAYVQDGNLWVWTEGVGAAMLYSGETVGSMIMSPDGEVVVFRTLSGWDITGLWAINSDGTNLHQLLTSAQLNSMSTNPSAVSVVPEHWQFVPGTHNLAFNTRLIFDGPGYLIQDDIRLIDVDTAALSILVAPGNAGYFRFSPDGSAIAFTTPTGIHFMDGDGTNTRANVVSFPHINTASEYSYLPSIRWAADSSGFVTHIPSQEPWGPGASYSVFEVSMLTETSTLVQTVLSPTSLFPAFTPFTSPDFSFAVANRRDTTNAGDIMLVNLATGAETLYHGGDNPRFLSWADEGSYFLYEVFDQLYLGEWGAPPVAIPTHGPSINIYPIDASRFVVASGSYGDRQIVIYTLDGAGTLITTVTDEQLYLAVSP